MTFRIIIETVVLTTTQKEGTALRDVELKVL